jgi:Raf kinase inhibitor-like YbhB/YbcL family protein
MEKNSHFFNENNGFELSCPAFAPDGLIPVRYTCEGEGISPVLEWTAGPEGTLSYALVMVDKDIPFSGEFVHWIVFNLPAGCRRLPEHFTEIESSQMGANIAPNGAGKRRYYPPCPVGGAHTYVFYLYALNVSYLPLENNRMQQVLVEIKDHRLAGCLLKGSYHCTHLNIGQAFATNMRLMRK